MLGRREIVDGKVDIHMPLPSGSHTYVLVTVCLCFPVSAEFIGVSVSLRQAGEYTWLTYKQVYDTVIKVGAGIRSCGIGKVQMIVLIITAL
jgi:hypothetical protein